MSTPEQREADRLSEQAEALLDGWPAPSRSALEWEDLANATVARIRETTVGSTDDDLLAPPLPKEDAEGEHSQKHTSPPEPADEPGLLAIAKAAVATGAGEDAKDIVRAGLRAAEHGRQSHPPAPPRHAAGHRRGTPSSAAGLQGHLPKSSVRPVEAVHEAQARSELPARPAPSGGKAGPGMIVAGAMLALAAGVALYIGIQNNSAEPVAATSHESAQGAVPAGAAETPPAAEAPGAGKPQTLALEDLKPTDVENLPEEHGKVAVPSATSPMTLALKSQEDRPAANSARAAPAKKTAAPTLGNAAPADPQQQAVALKEAEEAATSPGSTQSGAGAADKQGALPSRPSSGAITAALGSVSTGAKSCLAGQETGSKASVVFGSDGHVKSVSLSGPAAGTPAEGCVRSALMGARVPPFSEPEYSVSFTVRPP